MELWLRWHEEVLEKVHLSKNVTGCMQVIREENMCFVKDYSTKSYVVTYY
uniref:Uncharacterized protein n=1 Tax=Anguilla anguilla TaxID=7936 RepID=A0A0E9UE26_ANGAN